MWWWWWQVGPYGSPRFDLRVRTPTVRKLVGRLDSRGIEQYVDLLLKRFNQPLEAYAAEAAQRKADAEEQRKAAALAKQLDAKQSEADAAQLQAAVADRADDESEAKALQQSARLAAASAANAMEEGAVAAAAAAEDEIKQTPEQMREAAQLWVFDQFAAMATNTALPVADRRVSSLCLLFFRCVCVLSGSKSDGKPFTTLRTPYESH
jgi:hypothetical protein